MVRVVVATGAGFLLGAAALYVAGGDGGRRVTVVDGDTLRVAGMPVRLCGIDAPEHDTAAGRRARAALADLVAGRSVTCTLVGRGTPCDRHSDATSYDRVVAQCHAGGTDLAAALVEQGHAAPLPRYSGDHYATE